MTSSGGVFFVYCPAGMNRTTSNTLEDARSYILYIIIIILLHYYNTVVLFWYTREVLWLDNTKNLDWTSYETYSV